MGAIFSLLVRIINLDLKSSSITMLGDIFLDKVITNPQPDIGQFLYFFGVLTAGALSTYGFAGIMRYGGAYSKASSLLKMAFFLIMMVNAFEAIAHLTPLRFITDSWNNIQPLLGMMAVYFLYEYVRSGGGQIDEGKYRARFAVLSVAAVVFGYAETYFIPAYPLLNALDHAIQLATLLYMGWLIYRIFKAARKVETAFSLKSLSISMVPIFALCLSVFIGMLSVMKLLYTLGAASPDNMVALYALDAVEGVSFIALGISVGWFTYMRGQIYNFYAPLRRFIDAKDALDAPAAPIKVAKPRRGKMDLG